LLFGFVGCGFGALFLLALFRCFSFLDTRRQNKRAKQEGPKVKTRGAQQLTFRIGKTCISHRDKWSSVSLSLFGLLVAALVLCSFFLCFFVFIVLIKYDTMNLLFLLAFYMFDKI